MSQSPPEGGHEVSVLLGLGSNLGDRKENLEQAVALLEGAGAPVRERSSWIETDPVGGPPQPMFLNGAVEVRTRLGPRDLLAALHRIEARLGRVREARYGPREIDLDILAYGDLVLRQPDLEVPHPRLLSRAFVLDPLCEIAAERRHPLTGRTYREHRADLERAPREAGTHLRILENLRATLDLCGRLRAAGLSVGFVPTLGALHEGHASLFRRARAECDRVVASIFVNPTQFGPGEDLETYPRPREADVLLSQEAGVDLLFFAPADEMYPEAFQTWVTVEKLSKPLCGASRPVHFRGVATVVTQLLAIVRPHRAYFGQKDYQQTRIVLRLVEDLHLDTEIIVCPTVREADGLAMSSRNARLEGASRQAAPRLRRALVAARRLILDGEARVPAILARLREELGSASELRIDYAEVRDAGTLEEFPDGKLRWGPGGVLIAIAAFVGSTRLIDNEVIQGAGDRG